MESATDNAVHLTVDIVLFARRHGALNVLLIQRRWDPYAGCWALPGGYVDAGERIETAARRELSEETGLTAPTVWQRVGTYDTPERDPRGRVISTAYAAVLTEATTPVAGDDAREAAWFPLADVLTAGIDLAFDHDDILHDAHHLMRKALTRRARRKHALREYRAAKADLEEISKRDKTETDDYLAVNRRVIEAEKHVPWWRR